MTCCPLQASAAGRSSSCETVAVRQQLALQLTAVSKAGTSCRLSTFLERGAVDWCQRLYLWGQGPQQLASQVAQGFEVSLQLLCWQTPRQQPPQMLWWLAEESCEQPLALHDIELVRFCHKERRCWREVLARGESKQQVHGVTCTQD